MKQYVVGIIVAVGLVIGSAAPAQAQERVVSSQTVTITGASFWKKLARVATLGIVQATDTVKQGDPFRVAADHNGIDTDDYQLLVNTALHATLPVSALVNGTIEFPFPGGLSKGTYTFVVVARGPGGLGTSASLALSVTAGNPAAPGQIRIIKGQ